MISTRVISCLLAMAIALLAGCASMPPKHQENLCTIFDQYPEWYDAAKDSQERWGTPPHILMAFVKQESAFHHDATPPWDWFLFIPLGPQSSAEGYAQAKDGTWEEYEDEAGGVFSSRSTWRTPWISSAGTTTKAAESSAYPNGIPSASIWLTMKGEAAIGVGATSESRRSCASRIVWIGKPGSTALNCVNANIGSGVDTGINSGHSAAETPASDHGRVL